MVVTTKKKESTSKKGKSFSNLQKKKKKERQKNGKIIPRITNGYKQPNQSSLDSRLWRGSDACFEASGALLSGCVEWLILEPTMRTRRKWLKKGKRTFLLIALVLAIPKLDESIEIYELLVSWRLLSKDEPAFPWESDVIYRWWLTCIMK